MLAASQQTLICLLIPHILMDWGIIWWTSCALSLSTVDLFLPRSHFGASHLWIPPGSSMKAQFDIERQALPHLRQSGWPWQQKLKCFCVCVGLEMALWSVTPPPKPLHQYVKKTNCWEILQWDCMLLVVKAWMKSSSFFLSASLELSTVCVCVCRTFLLLWLQPVGH